MMAFNHYVVIPEGRSCYIDTYSYGRFDAFLSVSSVLNVTMSTSVYQDGVCLIDQERVPLEPGALTGDQYCQIYLEVAQVDCDGCPDYQRRIEVYSNSAQGCPADEFVTAVIPEEEEEEPEPEDNEPEETNEGNSNDDEEEETSEEGSSFYIKASNALISAMAILVFEY